MRLARLSLIACIAALVAAPFAGAAARMWVGFHDDPSFRWEGDRAANIDRAAATNATMFRAVVTWADVAKTRPANASNPFDPAYQLGENTFPKEFQDRFHLPPAATNGGAETMYPEFMDKLKQAK